MENYAIDTAARFGEIPFVEFTKELVTGVFDSLVDAHIEQMEEYVNFVSSLSSDLSNYINNTKDNVTFDQISDFVLNYDLPKVDATTLSTALSNLAPPATGNTINEEVRNMEGSDGKWWQGLLNTLAPAVSGLVDKIKDPNLASSLNALIEYNKDVINGTKTIPNYNDISSAIAALICSNKYGLLESMAKQGMMRLVVTEGEIETKITFSTWNTSESGNSTTEKAKEKFKSLEKRGIMGQVFRGRDKTKTKMLTVNTAKSYQRDSSGTKVDIFGRVLIRFKTDYAPLNG